MFSDKILLPLNNQNLPYKGLKMGVNMIRFVGFVSQVRSRILKKTLSQGVSILRFLCISLQKKIMFFNNFSWVIHFLGGQYAPIFAPQHKRFSCKRSKQPPIFYSKGGQHLPDCHAFFTKNSLRFSAFFIRSVGGQLSPIYPVRIVLIVFYLFFQIGNANNCVFDDFNCTF